MRDTTQLQAFLADVDRCAAARVGVAADGRTLVTLPLITEPTMDGAVYGQVLRWSGKPVAEKLYPGTWAVDLEALRAEVAAAVPADPEAARTAFMQHNGLL